MASDTMTTIHMKDCGTVASVFVNKSECEKASIRVEERGFYFEYEPGTELFSRGATPKVSSPQQRFTTEFGMESEWSHRANSTRKAVGDLLLVVGC